MAIIVQNRFPNDGIGRQAIGVDLPFNGPAVFKSNYVTREAIKSNLFNFFSTARGERVFNPFFGTALFKIVFEQITPITDDYISQIIEQELSQFFPFVNLVELNITAEEDVNNLFIGMKYQVQNFGILDEINIQV
jgi:phage baseplate assembly protein W